MNIEQNFVRVGQLAISAGYNEDVKSYCLILTSTHNNNDSTASI